MLGRVLRCDRVLFCNRRPDVQGADRGDHGNERGHHTDDDHAPPSRRARTECEHRVEEVLLARWQLAVRVARAPQPGLVVRLPELDGAVPDSRLHILPGGLRISRELGYQPPTKVSDPAVLQKMRGREADSIVKAAV